MSYLYEPQQKQVSEPVNPSQFSLTGSPASTCATEDAFQRLKEKLMSLAEQLAILSIKIAPSLLPESPCNSTCKDMPVPPSSHLVMTIDDMANRVTALRMTVDDLIKRCQL